jgi:hypothetical protein
MPLATIAEADAEWARNVGADRPQSAWILSDRDVWYPNPAYSGPPVPHPESEPDYERYEEDEAEFLADQERTNFALDHADPLDPNAYRHLTDPYEREIERQERRNQAARGQAAQGASTASTPAAYDADLYDDDLPF